MQGEAGNERMERRIIALLVAFAGLAERTASRCFAVRFIVLLVLRRAEAIARDYVADAAFVDGLWFDDGMEARSRPEDAMLLGQRFRWLAAVLTGLLPAEGDVGRRTMEARACIRRACHRAAPPAGRLRAAGAPTPLPHDTS